METPYNVWAANEIERLRARVAELEAENDRLVSEVAAWQGRFSDYCFDLASKSIVKD